MYDFICNEGEDGIFINVYICVMEKLDKIDKCC